MDSNRSARSVITVVSFVALPRHRALGLCSAQERERLRGGARLPFDDERPANGRSHEEPAMSDFVNDFWSIYIAGHDARRHRGVCGCC